MKLFRFQTCRKASGGFSLVEAVLSIGVMSFGFLSLAPLLAVGLNGARLARENRATAQIAATLFEEAKQGTLAAGPFYFDSALESCAAAGAVYTARETAQPLAGANGAAVLTRIVLRITPVGAPDWARTYADVVPTPP